MAVDTVLVAIACVLSFAIVVNFYTWTQSVMAVVLSQKDRVMKAAGQVKMELSRIYLGPKSVKIGDVM